MASQLLATGHGSHLGGARFRRGGWPKSSRTLFQPESRSPPLLGPILGGPNEVATRVIAVATRQGAIFTVRQSPQMGGPQVLKRGSVLFGLRVAWAECEHVYATPAAQVSIAVAKIPA